MSEQNRVVDRTLRAGPNKRHFFMVTRFPAVLLHLAARSWRSYFNCTRPSGVQLKKFIGTRPNRPEHLAAKWGLVGPAPLTVPAH